MNGRERIALALNHREADKVPVDFGACAQTTIHVSVIAGLREHFGLPEEPVKVEEPYTMMGRLDEDLKRVMKVDVDALNPRSTFFGVPRTGWKEFRMEDGLEVLVPGDFQVRRDAKGDLLTYPQGDTSVAPSARMPKGGWYFDAIIRQESIVEDRLRAEDNLEEFTLLGEEDLAFLEAGAADLEGSGRARLGVAPGAGLGDIACVPAPWLKAPKGIRDIEEWYVSTLTRPELLHEIFDRQTDIAVENLARIYERIG
jgi:hypothetical protein